MGGVYERNMTLKVAEIGDVIITANSVEVPTVRLLPRGDKPKQMEASWPVELFPDQGFEGAMDGADKTEFGSTARDSLSAYGMSLRSEGYKVGDIAEQTQTHGVAPKKESAKQKADDGINLGIKMERQVLSNVDTRAEAAPNVTFRSRGMGSWLSATAQSVKPVDSKYLLPTACVYTGTLAAYDAEDLEAQLRAAATATRRMLNLTMPCGLALKQRMSLWLQKVPADASYTFLGATNQNAKDKELIQMVDTFRFDAGTVRTIPSFFLMCDETTGAPTAYTTRSGFGIDLKQWELCYFIKPELHELPDLGGGPRGFHKTMYLLKCKMPLGQIAVTISADS
jgi:hypothetical protein